MSRGGQPSAAQRIWQSVEQIKEDPDDANDFVVISTVMVLKGHIYDKEDPAW